LPLTRTALTQQVVDMLLLILANNVPLQKHGLILSAISALNRG
jgi:hypothetical protein